MTDPASAADLIRSTPARQPNPNAAQAVLDAASRLFGYTVEEIVGPSRAPSLVEARQVAMCVIRATTTLTLNEMGRLFDRDHTTVHASVEKVLKSDVLRSWAAAVDLEVTTPTPVVKRAGGCHRRDQR